MYQKAEPPRHLKKYIDCFWFGDDLDLPQKPNTYHSIASSRIEILFFDKGIYSLDFNGKMEPVHRAGIYGQTTNFNLYTASAPRTTIFGITLKPLALPCFLNIPASEVTNQRIELEALLGNQGKKLSEKIYASKCFESKIQKAIAFFNSRMTELDGKYLAVEKLILKVEDSSSLSIPALVNESCLSSRQFERSFKELTGFSAKTYLKLRRFESFVEALSEFRPSSKRKLLDIALNLGYYDQSHLNRHFKEFTGISPLTYLSNSILLHQ